MPVIVKKEKPSGDSIKKTMGDPEGAASAIKKFIGDVSKSSASKQIILGASSGWVTGFLSMRVGKTAAMALGGGIILLQIANEKGYIKVNWDKVNRNLDQVADKVEEQLTGEAVTWMDKGERFVDRKLDQAKDVVKKGQKKAKRWYSGNNCQLKDVHIFMISFVAGVAIGIGTS